MDNTTLKKLLVEIPVKLCRSMNNEFIKSILKDLQIDFSPQHFMILKLLEENKQLYVTEFVEKLSITKPQMTSLLDKLSAMGYITRTNDIDDRRKIYISATREGEATTIKINTAIDNHIDNRLVRLTPVEIDTLESGLLMLQKFCFDCSKEIE
ncbi:MAG: MarR family transcriptional regulator [Bacteroidales bacterium]|nr:MarR family transcriptional regulator [Bacteroidales bacterium]